MATLWGGTPFVAKRTFAVTFAMTWMLKLANVPALIVMDEGSIRNRTCPVAVIVAVLLVWLEVV